MKEMKRKVALALVGAMVLSTPSFNVRAEEVSNEVLAEVTQPEVSCKDDYVVKYSGEPILDKYDLVSLSPTFKNNHDYSHANYLHKEFNVSINGKTEKCNLTFSMPDANTLEIETSSNVLCIPQILDVSRYYGNSQVTYQALYFGNQVASAIKKVVINSEGKDIYICKDAFISLERLSEITYDNDLTFIGDNAFYATSLGELTLSENTYLEDKALNGLYTLDIVSKSEEPKYYTLKNDMVVSAWGTLLGLDYASGITDVVLSDNIVSLPIAIKASVLDLSNTGITSLNGTDILVNEVKYEKSSREGTQYGTLASVRVEKLIVPDGFEFKKESFKGVNLDELVNFNNASVVEELAFEGATIGGTFVINKELQTIESKKHPFLNCKFEDLEINVPFGTVLSTIDFNNLTVGRKFQGTIGRVNSKRTLGKKPCIKINNLYTDFPSVIDLGNPCYSLYGTAHYDINYEIIENSIAHKTYLQDYKSSYYYSVTATPLKFTVTYSGAENLDTEERTWGSDFNLPQVSKEGYDFIGWFRNEAYTVPIETIPYDNLTDISVYAKWEPVQYNITYNLNDGVLGTANPATYTIEDSINLVSPVRENYKFLGWSVEGTDTYISSIPQGSTGDLVLNADWECTHNEYRLLDKLDATCYSDGYTGDKLCNVCGVTINGEVIPKVEHIYNEGVITKEPTYDEEGTIVYTCTFEGCNTSKEEVLKKLCDHVNTELQGTKDATCKEDGYTGDKYCKDCNELVEKGVLIKKVSHTWVDDKYCSVCNTLKEDNASTENVTTEDNKTTEKSTEDNKTTEKSTEVDSTIEDNKTTEKSTEDNKTTEKSTEVDSTIEDNKTTEKSTEDNKTTEKSTEVDDESGDASTTEKSTEQDKTTEKSTEVDNTTEDGLKTEENKTTEKSTEVEKTTEVVITNTTEKSTEVKTEQNIVPTNNIKTEVPTITNTNNTEIDTSKVKVKIKKLVNKKKGKLQVVIGTKGYRYQIQVSTSKKFKKGTKQYDTNKTSYTVKKLKVGKKYYIRARVYKVLDGKKVYGKWSSKGNIKIVR